MKKFQVKVEDVKQEWHIYYDVVQVDTEDKHYVVITTGEGDNFLFNHSNVAKIDVLEITTNF